MRYLSDKSPEVTDRLMAPMTGLWKLIGAGMSEGNASMTGLNLHNLASSIDKIWIAFQKDAVLYGLIKYDSSGETVYRDGSTALTVAYFATTQVMLSLARTLGPAPSSQTNEDQCQAILNCASFLLRRRKSLGCAGLAMLLPLTLVGLHGSSSECRRIAYSYLDIGFRSTEFGGLRSIALQRIHSSGFQGSVPLVQST